MVLLQFDFESSTQLKAARQKHGILLHMLTKLECEANVVFSLLLIYNGLSLTVLCSVQYGPILLQFLLVNIYLSVEEKKHVLSTSSFHHKCGNRFDFCIS